MNSHNQMCDNVTTCDNLILAGCHAVSACFTSECDNVTTKTPCTPIRARTCTPHFTMSQMSQCHILLKNSDLECDNLNCRGCHVVTPSFKSLTRCQLITKRGNSSTNNSYVTNLVMRLQSIKVKVSTKALSSILLGLLERLALSISAAHRLASQFLQSFLSLILINQTVGAWASELNKKLSISARNTGSTKKVLLRGNGYGSMMRGIALVSNLKNSVSFRFILNNQ